MRYSRPMKGREGWNRFEAGLTVSPDAENSLALNIDLV